MTTQQPVIEVIENGATTTAVDIAPVRSNLSLVDTDSNNKVFYCSVQNDGSRATQVKLYNAIQNPHASLADMIGQVLSIKDIIAQEIEVVDEQTGELRSVLRTVLLDEKGLTYVAVSDGITNALRNIIKIVGMPTWEEPVKMKIRQEKSKNNAMYKFLTIELV